MKLDKEACRRLDWKLYDRCKRLTLIVRRQAPDCIVEGAIRLVLQAGLGRYTGLAASIFHEMARNTQARLGVCSCGTAIEEPAKGDWPEFCPTCQARQDEEDERAAVDALRDEELDAEEL